MNPYESPLSVRVDQLVIGDVAEIDEKLLRSLRAQCYFLACGFVAQVPFAAFIIFVACIMMGSTEVVWGLSVFQQRLVTVVCYAIVGGSCLFCALMACTHQHWALRAGLVVGYLSICLNSAVTAWIVKMMVADLWSFQGGDIWRYMWDKLWAIVPLLFFGTFALIAASTTWQSLRVLRKVKQLRT